MENIGGRNFWSTKQIEVSGKEKFGEYDEVNNIPSTILPYLLMLTRKILAKS